MSELLPCPTPKSGETALEPSAADLAWLKQAAGLPNMPTPLTYLYRISIGGDGPLTADWSDKPHRLVYDLCRHIEQLAAENVDAAPASPESGPLGLKMQSNPSSLSDIKRLIREAFDEALSSVVGEGNQEIRSSCSNLECDGESAATPAQRKSDGGEPKQCRCTVKVGTPDGRGCEHCGLPISGKLLRAEAKRKRRAERWSASQLVSKPDSQEGR